MTYPRQAPIYPWMRPAWWLGRVRPGLGAATAADTRRLRELPALIGAVLLPALAIGLPVLLAIGHATTLPRTAPPPTPDPTLLIVYDVFTESLPFVLAASLVGLMAPAAGVLLVMVYGITNIGVTVWSGELAPVLPATIGRLTTYLVLWLLVVEIPLLGRAVFEWWSSRDESPGAKRGAALIASAACVGVLSYSWALAAPLLMVGVYLSSGRTPPSLPTQILERHDAVFALLIGIATLGVFGVRYLGRSAHVARMADEPGDPSGGAPSRVLYLVSLGLVMLLLSSVLREPTDVVILLAGLLLARPIGGAFLRVTRLAPRLARVAWPIRLIAGFGVALAFAWYFVAIVGASRITPFFTSVVTITICLVIIEFFRAADDVTGPAAPRERSGTVASIILLFWLMAPAVAWADNRDGDTDTNLDALAKAAAGSAAGGAAFRDALRKKYPPKELPEYSGPQGQDTPKGPPPLKDFDQKPPNWYDKYLPDGFSDFFG
jgi:hypothetical protein